MTHPTVAVVTDSAASLPSELARAWGIIVVPLQVIIGDTSRAEGVGIASSEVVDALESGAHVSTSQPGVEAFKVAYAEAVAGGAAAIVSVHIAASMSGTAANAHAAAAECAVPVTVVDSQTMAMATGFAALGAAALARTGADAAEVAREAERIASSSVCLFTVDTLEYLRRGGRINGAVAAIGRTLGIRPVLGIRDAQIEPLARVRSSARARDAVAVAAIESARGLARPGVAVLAVGDGDFAADALAVIVAGAPGVVALVEAPVSAVLAAHTGPGTLAVVVADVGSLVTGTPPLPVATTP